MAPQLHHGTGLYASGHHALAHLAQAGRRVRKRPVLAVGVGTPAPQHLGGGAGPRPQHHIEGRRIDLLGPDVHFAAKHQRRLLFRQELGRRVRVDQSGRPLATALFSGMASEPTSSSCAGCSSPQTGRTACMRGRRNPAIGLVMVSYQLVAGGGEGKTNPGRSQDTSSCSCLR